MKTLVGRLATLAFTGLSFSPVACFNPDASGNQLGGDQPKCAAKISCSAFSGAKQAGIYQDAVDLLPEDLTPPSGSTACGTLSAPNGVTAYFLNRSSDDAVEAQYRQRLADFGYTLSNEWQEPCDRGFDFQRQGVRGAFFQYRGAGAFVVGPVTGL